MLVTGIKSKPVYSPLCADTHGRYHVMLGIGVGADPLLRVLKELRDISPMALEHTQVLYVPAGDSPDGRHVVERFKTAGVIEARGFETSGLMLTEFREVLTESLMGTRVYAAGPESFIGLAMQIALEFNLNKDEIRAEECGSAARRVYCIHCRFTTDDVRTNIVQCERCSRWLLVRDHYSRRLAAYMGVMVDAEAPGELPPIREIFS